MTLPSSGPLSLSDIQGEFGGSNPIGINEYYAGGGLVPSGTTGTYGAVPSSGTISVQNFYGTSNYIPVYVEELFSTWLYTGNGGTQTITNGINLSGNGGLTWIKCRSNAFDHALFDTARGVGYGLRSNTTSGNVNFGTDGLSAFNSNGFTVKDNGVGVDVNYSGGTFTSWTFRKQPKFFDVVTYTGTGSATTIAHSLGSVPGCIIVKRTDSSGFDWAVYHTSTGNTKRLLLNTTDPAGTSSGFWNNTTPTSTVFTVGTNVNVNASGGTYVAYLFAHNAGGFGPTGSDNVITCGTFNSSGGVDTITLGYEPQWVLYRCATNYSDWRIADTMRGMSVAKNTAILYPNLSNVEQNAAVFVTPTATGFNMSAGATIAGEDYIYIAIRRGPMKVPTDATTVFKPVAQTGGGTVTTNFPIDLIISTIRTGDDREFRDRLRGGTTTSGLRLRSNSTGQELSNSTGLSFQSNTSSTDTWYSSGQSVIYECFRRAPGFFDEVCWTGTGAFDQTVTHNLGVIPTLLITKIRNFSGNWRVNVDSGSGAYPMLYMYLNDTSGSIASGTNPNTSTTCVPLSTTGYGETYVTYLFATCPGVSKVGSYTGTGATQTISCGFTGGARFVLIKRTNSNGDWYYWDTARGMVSGTDPSLLLNTVTAEDNTNSVYTTTGGFQIVSTAADINASGSTYIYLAIA